MPSQLPTYRSFLLRLWYAQVAGHAEWRASLEDPNTGERIGFATPEMLLAFLSQPPPTHEQPMSETREEPT